MTFSITPNGGYAISQVLVNGTNNPAAVSNGSYPFTGVTANQTISVVFSPITTTNVAWTGLTANGASGTANTTALTLTFDADPGAGFTAANITVTGAAKGTLSGSGTTRTLAISNITVGDGANVTVAITSPSGLDITPASKTVRVFKAFGTVPSTGLPDVTWAALAMFVFLLLSAALWIYIIRRRLIKG